MQKPPEASGQTVIRKLGAAVALKGILHASGRAADTAAMKAPAI